MNSIQVPDFINGIKQENLTFYDYRFDSTLSELNSQLILSENAVVFCLKGSIRLRCSGMNQLSVIESDSICLMKSGALIRPKLSEEKNSSFRAIMIFFTDEALLQITENLKIKISDDMSKRQFFIQNNDSYVQYLTEGLKFISNSSSSQIKLLMKLKLEELFIYLHQNKKNLSFNLFVHSCVNNISQLKKIVERYKYEKRTLDELASMCYMSVSTFKRKFVETYGVSPIKWFSDQRLEYAASIISLNPNKKFRDLYLKCGYSSRASFKNAFVRKFNKVPEI